MILALNQLNNTIQNPMQDWRIADYFHNLLFHLLLKIVPYTPSYKLFINLHLLVIVIAIAIVIGAMDD